MILRKKNCRLSYGQQNIFNTYIYGKKIQNNYKPDHKPLIWFFNVKDHLS